MKGARMSPGLSLRDELRNLAAASLSSGFCTSVMMPVRTDSGDYIWSLITDPVKLSGADPLPPVMTVNGAKALSSFARGGEADRILAFLRPCEARAAVELSKLEQLDQEKVFMVTMDCTGAVPLRDWLENRELEPDISSPSSLRPLCRQCVSFTGEGDICLTDHGDPGILIPLTDKGVSLLEALDYEITEDCDAWKAWTAELVRERDVSAAAGRAEMSTAYAGLDGLAKLFSGCIGCRSCRTVCPICYCRLCFIDMKDRRFPASDHLRRSERAGASRLSSNTLLFHIGRMAHMSLSCVSCGMCEDACPSDIPIGRLVGMVSERTTDLFDYRAGGDRGGLLPLNTFEKDELHEFED